jgi:hypothetical protein
MGVLVVRSRPQVHKDIFKERKATVWDAVLRRSQGRSSRAVWKFKWSSDAAKAPKAKRTDN